MLIEGRHYRSIWRETGDRPIEIIDQTCLPYDSWCARCRIWTPSVKRFA